MKHLHKFKFHRSDCESEGKVWKEHSKEVTDKIINVQRKQGKATRYYPSGYFITYIKRRQEAANNPLIIQQSVFRSYREADSACVLALEDRMWAGSGCVFVNQLHWFQDSVRSGIRPVHCVACRVQATLVLLFWLPEWSPDCHRFWFNCDIIYYIF